MNNRRTFLKQVALGTGAAIVANRLWGVPVATGGSDKLGQIMPTRPFGKTGENVTIFCLGGYHVGAAPLIGEDPQAIIEHSLEQGVRFFDTAHNYQNGKSEELYGQHLTPKYRDQIFLMSKTQGRNKADAEKHLEESLRRLKTDYLDLWLMHSVTSAEDVDNRLSGGALEAMLEAKQSGKVRYLGFSGHRISEGHRRLIEKVAGDDPFDYVQLPLNAVDATKPDSFVSHLLPDLVDRGYAIGAMKTLAGGHFLGKSTYPAKDFHSDDPIIPKYISLEEAFWFALSLPVSCIVSGAEKLDNLKQNIDIAKRFAKLTLDDQKQIAERVSKFGMTPGLEYYRPDPRTMV